MRINARSISEEVARICEQHSGVVSVVLNGSCARGEETYFINSDGQNEMMSDYEMLIIVKDTANREAISQSLTELRNQLLTIRSSENFDLEWSYKTLDDLRRLDKRFFFFETKESARVIYGDKDIIGLFPDINLQNLNYSELNTVIIHRLYHVIRDLGSTDEKYKKYLIARNTLDFATALLPLCGVLVASYEKRKIEIEKIATELQLPDELLQRQRDYLAMKKDYSSNLYDSYYYKEMLRNFYTDFELLKKLQAQLQGGRLFRNDKRRLLSSIYRGNLKGLKNCIQWQERLTVLCEDMFKTIKNGEVSESELSTLKVQMSELFGYC